jgi:hypothetical protein
LALLVLGLVIAATNGFPCAFTKVDAAMFSSKSEINSFKKVKTGFCSEVGAFLRRLSLKAFAC